MCLKFLNKVRDWKSFGEAMMTLNAEAFLWCDLFIANTYRDSGGRRGERR